MNDETKPQDPDSSTEETPEVETPATEPVVSRTDLVVLLALALAGAGFWWWYSGAKHDSTRHFAHADSLYQAGRLSEALAEYRTLREKEEVIGKGDDSIMYRRMDSLETIAEKTGELVRGARAALLSGDTALVRRAREVLEPRAPAGFVPASLLDSLRR